MDRWQAATVAVAMFWTRNMDTFNSLNRDRIVRSEPSSLNYNIKAVTGLTKLKAMHNRVKTPDFFQHISTHCSHLHQYEFIISANVKLFGHHR